MEHRRTIQLPQKSAQVDFPLPLWPKMAIFHLHAPFALMIPCLFLRRNGALDEKEGKDYYEYKILPSF